MAWPSRQHGDLEMVSSNVWRVEGAVPRMVGIRRQMVVLRDSEKRLLLHSAIALDERRMAQLQGLGTLTWLVVPNGYHRLDAPAFKERFPSLVVVSPSGAIPRVRERLPVDLAYEAFPANACIRARASPWSEPKEGVLEMRDSSGTVLVFNDLLFNPPRTGIRSWPYRWLSGCDLQVPWLARRMFAPDARQLRRWLLSLAELQHLNAIIPGHGDPVTANAANALRQAARRLGQILTAGIAR